MSNNNTNTSIPEGEEENYSLAQAGWIAFVVILSPATLLNFLTFILILISKLKKSISSQLVAYLCLGDGIFSLICLLQCGLNYYNKEMIGGEIACQFQAIYTIFFVMSTDLTLCLIAHNSDRKIRLQQECSTKQLILFHLLIWFSSGLFSVLFTVLRTGAIEDTSHTHCLIAVQDLFSGLAIYVLSILLVTGTLLFYYIHIFLMIRQHSLKIDQLFKKKQEQEHTFTNIPTNNKETFQQIKLIKRLFILVLAFLLCSTPLLLICFYEWISSEQASSEIYIFGIAMVHFNSLLNPILYFWLNGYSRKVLWNKIFQKRSSAAFNSQVYPINISQGSDLTFTVRSVQPK